MPRGDITGFVLAGGRSRRMGGDKSELPWRGQSFLEHAISRMQEVCDRVFVLGESTTATVPALEDTFAGDGPLAGLHTALVHSATDWNLLLVIERALSQRELSIRRLLQHAAQGMMGEEFKAMRVIDQYELSSAGFAADMLMNVNTPADFERAKRLAERLNVQ